MNISPINLSTPKTNLSALKFSFKGQCMMPSEEVSSDSVEISRHSSPLFRQDAKYVDVSKINPDLKESKITSKDLSYLKRYYKRSVNPVLYDFLKENRHSDLDDLDSLFDGVEYKKFNILNRFALMTLNTYQKQGSAFICDEIPKIFEGIEKEEIKNAIDNLMLEIQMSEKDEIVDFEIKGKHFRAKEQDRGRQGIIYKIEDNKGNCAAIKRYLKPNSLSFSQGMNLEIPISRQVTQDNVNNTPTFYMANPMPIFMETQTQKNIIKGGWMMREFIEEDTEVKNFGISLDEWLQNSMLINYDDSDDNFVGNYCVDLGCIGRCDYKIPFEASVECTLNCLQSGYDIPEMLSILEE